MAAHTSESALEGQRRQVTVLFADMADYTPTAEKLGEEATYTLMHRLIEQISEAVHGHDGTVQNLTGDGVMALFGAPVAIEDGPLKACRAALDIQKRLQSLEGEIEARHGIRPRFRIGIHTGPLIVGKVGDDQRAEITALGDTVNLASRLESEAEPGGILLSEATHRLVEGFVAATFAGEREIKGKAEAQRVHALDGLNEAVTRFDVSVSRGLTALVGRAAELGRLESAWNDVKAGGFRMIDLIGEAGIGKSRLVHDFRQRLDDNVFFLQGRCLSSGTATPFLPFIEVVRTSFRIGDGAGRIEAERRLKRGLETLGIEIEDTLPYLLNLLGHDVEDGVVKAIDSEAIGVRTRNALVTLLRKRRRVSPVILFIDDLHWMDHASEEILGRVCAEDMNLPLLLICAYRPGYAAPWRPREGAVEIRLDQLSNRGIEDLLKSRLDTDAVPDDLVDLVAERAQGNPLFAEEIIGYLRDKGAIATSESGIAYQADDIGALPVTLENLLMDRFDRLAPGPRRALEAAAVIGTSFSPDLLGAAVDDGAVIGDDLEQLERDGLILTDEAIAGAFRFKHILVREAIYDSLLAPRREVLHGCVAEAIENSGGESADILSYHYAKTSNTAKAVHYLALAGEKSLIIYSLDEAETRFRDAIERIESEPDAVEDVVLVDILLKLARVLYFTIEFYDIIAMVERYLPVVERLGDRKRLARFLFETGYAHVFSARHDIGKPMLERALAIGEEIDDAEIIGYVSMGLMWHYQAWEPATPETRETVLRLSDTGFRIGEELRDVWLASKSLAGPSVYYNVLGFPDECRRYALKLMELGRTTNDPRPRAMGLWSMAILNGVYGAYDEAIANAEEAIAIGLSPVDRAFAQAGKARALAMTGRADEAVRILAEVNAKLRNGGLLVGLTATDFPYGLALAMNGDLAQAVRWIDESGRRFADWGFTAGPATADLYLGEIYLEMAIGAEKPPWSVMRRNLWFLLRSVPVAGAKARHHLESAAAFFGEADMPALHAWALLDLGRLDAAKRGDRARAYFEEARPIAESVHEPALVERIDQAMAALD